MIKEKIKKAVPPRRKEPQSTPVPIPPGITSICADNDDVCTVVSTITNSAHTTASSKRKKPSNFTFPARKLSIVLYAPIETMEKNFFTITGVSSGKTNKEFVFDLDPFIFLPADCLDSEELVDEDERFIALFSLSRFRKDMLQMSMEKFPEEYAVRTKSLGPRCKLFHQKQWNQSSWTEMTSTAMFHKMLKEQMSTSSRVKDGFLFLRLSFGRAKSGMEFTTKEDAERYLRDDALLFSQSVEEPSSPLVRKVGAIKRTTTWNQPTKIMELLNNLFTNEESKSYYGFLQEHGSSFVQIIMANISVKKEESVFAKALKDPTANVLTNELLDQHLLHVYVHSHKNDVNGRHLLE